MRVKGEGPKGARVMLIGEAPGREEDLKGRPFVGAAGRELDRFLQSVDIDRSECYVTNLVKERPPDNRDPLFDEIARDEAELVNEISDVGPDVIVTLGRFSTRWALGDVDMETVHGIPHQIHWPEPEKPMSVVPCYHPAAGLHSPDVQAYLQYDFEQLRLLLDGKLSPYPPADEYPNPEYILQRDGGEPIPPEVLTQMRRSVMAIDTEGVSGSPWGLSYTFEPGKAFVVKADNKFGLKWVQTFLDNAGQIVFHNILHDLAILREMGITVPIERSTDTMIMAYLLCLEPQGLKQLARRHCGMEMHSYKDVTREADQRVAKSYLESVIMHRACPQCSGTGEVWQEGKPKKSGKPSKGRIVKCPACGGDGTTWPKPEPELVFENGKAKEYQAQSIGRRVRKTLMSSEDPRNWWETQDEDLRAPIEAEVGLMPPTTLDEVDPDVAVNYSARDADATHRVNSKLSFSVGAMGLRPVLDMDLRIIPMIDRMQEVGWLIDIPYFNKLTSEFESQMSELQRTLTRTVGHYVNPSSSKQVGNLLFRELELPVLKMTKSKTRESTDDKTLEALALQIPKTDERAHSVLSTILHYKELHKLVSTYTRALPLWADCAGRVHPHLRVTRTASGRLSAHDPNLQNIPIRPRRGRDNGKRIREGFVCRPGWRLGAWDLNQIEMRILAHESRDENLIRLFVEGAVCPERGEDGKCACHDIHRYTASLIYRKLAASVTDGERMLAKNIGFGIVYGITAKGLKAQMDQRGEKWTEDECQSMIDAYLNDAYPGVRDFMEERAAEARRFGYVRDMFGRIRYLPAVHSTAQHVASEALRQAGNHPIQAGAQGVIKLAMAKVWESVLPALWAQGFEVQCLMQIHDELVFEFEDGLEDVLGGMVTRAFAEAVDLRVPIESSGHSGLNWSELK